MNADILRRERNERETFARIATVGRSARRDEELRIPGHTVEQYRACTDRPRAGLPLEQMIAWSGPLAGKRVLEICCHDAEYGTILALLGADVTAVDITEPLVKQASRRAEANGVRDRLRPSVMSAHALAFPAGSFDLVFGKSALHHLDLRVARDEIRRVLKPGGCGIFGEPIAFSPLLSALRRVTPVPVARESPDERQLTAADMEEFCRPFAARECRFFNLLGRLERIVPPADRLLAAIDTMLFSWMPALRKSAGYLCLRCVR